MVKTDILKGKIVERKTNYTECSKALGVTITTFCSKMNNKTEFSINQAKALSEYLELAEEEKIKIFLT